MLSHNVGPNPGWYYIQANGFNGAYSTTPYSIQATLTPPGPFGILILAHRDRMTKRHDATAVQVLFNKLNMHWGKSDTQPVNGFPPAHVIPNGAPAE